ncbi:hypothetical protein qu_974 [Acanthamoeba polyphaga mimivirus]|nr:hypothetical protein [Mimivirus reunion]WMV61346.1 hypothetical protein qu_8 [Mimivirus sp.]WMV62323.1 hypothetical protein qu_8 [Acanthamoeba polyphaga mimivirus]QTF49865.1 hypothetical protein [Mimivirus reunion]WMV62308.1 hypothetical protein qu_974 [Mimivirus sp.]
MSKSIKTHNNINKARFAVKISNLIEYGREEINSPITKDKVDKYPIGSVMSYTNMMDEFREGGFITNVKDDYFIYVTPDFQTKYRVKYKNIKKIWIGDVFKLKNDVVSLTKTTQEKTNYPVKIGKVVVYYGSNNYDTKRFQNTNKFKRIFEWYNYFNSN